VGDINSSLPVGSMRWTIGRRLVVSEEEADDDGRQSLLVFAGYMNSTERFAVSSGAVRVGRNGTGDQPPSTVGWLHADSERNGWCSNECLFASARLRVGCYMWLISAMRPGLAEHLCRVPGCLDRTQPPKGLLREAHVGLRPAAPLSLPKEANTRLDGSFTRKNHDSWLIDVPVSLWCFATRATARLTL
jgi:hypothetical protein